MLGFLAKAFSETVASRAPAAKTPNVANAAGTTPRLDTASVPASDGDHSITRGIVDQFKRYFGLGALPVEIVRDRTKHDGGGGRQLGFIEKVKQAWTAAKEKNEGFGGSFVKDLLLGIPKRSSEGEQMQQEDLHTNAEANFPGLWKLGKMGQDMALKRQAARGAQWVSPGGTADAAAAGAAEAGEAAGAAGGAAEVAGAAGVLSGFVSGIGAAVAGLSLFYSITSRVTAAQLAAAAALAKYNGAISAALARAEVHDIRREIKSGKSTSASYDTLISTLDDFKEQWRPTGDVLSAGLNYSLAFMIGGTVTQIAAAAATVSELLPGIADRMDEKEEAADKSKLPFVNMLHTAADSLKDRDHPKPPPIPGR